ncbi:MAG: calcium-binding protein [Deltaproteobacteria bacterium]
MHIDPPRVRGLDTVALERDEVPILTRAADASARFDRPVVLAELDDLPRDRTVRLGARLLLGETQVVSRAVVSRFDSSRVVLLVLSSACRTLRCPPPGEPDATECESGRCVRPVCEGAACGRDAGAAEDDAASPEPDAALDSLPDAVVEPDAEPIDAGSDAACAPAIDEADTLSGTAADDYLRGLGGDDLVLAGGGSDFVNGNAGVDEIRGEDGPDVLFGGAEDDRVLGGPSDDFVSGDLGNDHVIGGGGTDRIAGGQGDDVLRGEEEDGSGFGNDRYWLDGLGNDEIIDTGGDDDVARCAPGVRVERDSRDGTDRLLSFSTGGSARIRSSAVERILGCGCAL